MERLFRKKTECKFSSSPYFFVMKVLEYTGNRTCIQFFMPVSAFPLL